MFRSLVIVLVVCCSLAGCATQRPETSLTATPTPTSSGLPAVLSIGSDGSPVGQLLAEVYAQALTAKHLPATSTLAPDDLSQALPKVTTGEIAVLPVFARSAATRLGVGELPDDQAELVQTLAQTLDGEAAVLQPGRVSADAVFVVRTELSTSRGITKLGDLTRLKQPVTLAAPLGFERAPEGPVGLLQVYRVRSAIAALDDPAARLAALERLPVAVFRQTEPQSQAAGLTVLKDPQGLVQADPQVALLTPSLADNLDVVPVLKAVDDQLTDAEVRGIRTRSASLGMAAAVADWLTAHGLG